MPIARFKRARVNIDCHVELDGHHYSVPHLSTPLVFSPIWPK